MPNSISFQFNWEAGNSKSINHQFIWEARAANPFIFNLLGGGGSKSSNNQIIWEARATESTNIQFIREVWARNALILLSWGGVLLSGGILLSGGGGYCCHVPQRSEALYGANPFPP